MQTHSSCKEYMKVVVIGFCPYVEILLLLLEQSQKHKNAICVFGFLGFGIFRSSAQKERKHSKTLIFQYQNLYKLVKHDENIFLVIDRSPNITMKTPPDSGSVKHLFFNEYCSVSNIKITIIRVRSFRFYCMQFHLNRLRNEKVILFPN